MKKMIILQLFLMVAVPLVCQAGTAGIPGFMKEQMGTLSGQVFTDVGAPLAGGGVVSFFNSEKGTPPLIAQMHRIPDMVGRMTPDGQFSIKLLPGSYYLGAMVITDPGRGPGPPQEGEKFYFARDDNGSLRKFILAVKEEKDVGKVVAALPDTFPMAKNFVTIEGRLLLDNGQPYKGGVVLVKTDMNKPRPDFVSERTGEDGMFKLQLPPDTPYYIMGRERAVGRPVPGTYIGTYGSKSAIAQGGALPIGTVRPAQPASGMPQLEGVDSGPGDDLPKIVMGKSGETLTGIDITMFEMPAPEAQREKLQGTLGFSNQTGQETGAEGKKIEPEPVKK